MTVYVDNARIPFRGMLMCHLFADSSKELHDFAARLHLHKYAYQKGDKLAHYQVSTRQRLTAIERGAQEVDVFWLRARIRVETDRILNRDKKPNGASGKDAARAAAVVHRASQTERGEQSPAGAVK